MLHDTDTQGTPATGAGSRRDSSSRAGCSSPRGPPARPLPVHPGADGGVGERLGLDGRGARSPPTSASSGPTTTRGSSSAAVWTPRTSARRCATTLYVLIVVLQTALALFLAVLVSGCSAAGVLPHCLLLPSVTSSVAITVLWLFLFSATGAVNKVLSWVSINGPNWFADPRGVLHVMLGWLGVSSEPAALASTEVLGISLWSGWPVRRWRCRRSS